MRMTIESKDTDDENTQAFFEITKKTRCTSVVDDFAEHAARLVREYHEFVSIANGVDQQDDGDYSDSDEDSGEEAAERSDSEGEDGSSEEDIVIRSSGGIGEFCTFSWNIT